MVKLPAISPALRSFLHTSPRMSRRVPSASTRNAMQWDRHLTTNVVQMVAHRQGTACPFAVPQGTANDRAEGYSEADLSSKACT